MKIVSLLKVWKYSKTKETSMLILLFSVLNIIFVASSYSQKIVEKPLSQRITNYRMDVELDVEKKTISGDMSVKWKNPSKDTVSDLQFHLYQNAFKNSKSLFFNEGSVYHRDEKEFGFTDVNDIRTKSGKSLNTSIRYIQPDFQNRFSEIKWTEESPMLPQDRIQDETVMQVFLDEPVLPGDSVEIRINFTTKLPKLTTRTGYAGDYFFVAQWFPKLGVYEYPGMNADASSGWNCHQFHRNSEFYSNHSAYDVNITLPEDFVVGSGGVVQSKEIVNGKQNLEIRAEDIVDFAWTASRDYILFEDQWKHVKIHALMQPEHAYQAQRHIDAVKGALEYLDEHVGPYPWPHATVVDPPSYGQAAGGMEYTTMFTAGTAYGLPKGIRMAELVTIHEFGHAYFMGILATNEFEEPWMDEGMNTYWENRIMDHLYGDGKGAIDLPFINIGDKEFSRITYLTMSNPKVADANRASWEFPHGSYGTLIYQKTATWLNTLENMISTPVMDEVFKTYYTRWAFKHPGTEDFISIVNEVVGKHYGDKFGEDMNWFFDQFLKSDKMVDYKLSGIRIREIPSESGFFGKSESKRFVERSLDLNIYRSTVGLERLEEAIVPVEILVHFDDGKEIVEYWDGKERAKDFVYERAAKVDYAVIDPDFKILMDRDLTNNSITLIRSKKTALKYGSKFMFLVQNLMQLISIFS